MRLPPFHLERMFAKHEFTCANNLTSSDVEGISLSELWDLVPDSTREAYESLTLGYTEGPGDPVLREHIARWTSLTDSGGVQVFAGATEALFVLFNALLSPGDHVLAVTPLYQLLLDVPSRAGAEVTCVRLARDDDWNLDIAALRAAMRPNTRMIVVNFPHNPTGSLPERAVFEELVDLVDGTEAYLVSDEIYRGAEMNPEDTLPSAATLSPQAITVAGVSKVFGMAGVRIGWVAAQNPRIAEKLLDYRYWTTLATSAPSEVLATAGLQAAPALLARARSFVAANAQALANFVAQTDGWSSVPLKGGTCAYPWIEADAGPWADRLALEAGILLASGSMFNDEHEHLRFGLGRSDFTTGLERLSHVLEAQPRLRLPTDLDWS